MLGIGLNFVVFCEVHGLFIGAKCLSGLTYWVFLHLLQDVYWVLSWTKAAKRQVNWSRFGLLTCHQVFLRVYSNGDQWFSLSLLKQRGGIHQIKSNISPKSATVAHNSPFISFLQLLSSARASAVPLHATSADPSRVPSQNGVVRVRADGLAVPGRSGHLWSYRLPGAGGHVFPEPALFSGRPHSSRWARYAALLSRVATSGSFLCGRAKQTPWCWVLLFGHPSLFFLLLRAARNPTLCVYVKFCNEARSSNTQQQRLY